MKNTAEQNTCVDLYSAKKPFKVESVAGSGKEQDVNCVVQTPTGPRRIGELVVGDLLFNTYGGVSTVLGVYPQGVKPSYRVSFRDGTYTKSGLDHLWELDNKGKDGKQRQVMSLKEILSLGITKTRGDNKHRVPLTNPVAYTTKHQGINPYLLGLLIGDGCLVGSTPALSFNVREVHMIEITKDISNSYNLRLNFRNTSTGGVQTTLVPRTKSADNTENWLMKEIKRLGLNVKSGDKFIPDNYLRGDVTQRKEVLRGLMDADGSCSKNRTGFTTTSRKLLEDITTLVQSLGGVAIQGKTDARDGRVDCYTLNVKTTFKPFGYSLKGNNWRLSKKNPPSRYITGIAYEGDTEQVCIKVSAGDSLYLTDNFIVTHNTTTVRIMAESDMERSALYLAFNKAAAAEAAEKMPMNTECRTTHSIAYRSIIGGDEAMRSKLSRPAWNPKKYVNAGGTVKEIKNLCKVKDVPGANKLAISRVAKQTVACFEASASKAITQDHIPHGETKKLKDKAKALNTAFSEKQFCEAVVRCAKVLWEARIDRSSPVVMTHDTYLKLYQLSGASLNYDVIFLDEAQDTSNCVIDIVMQQSERGTQVVAVGDTYQSIYEWRGAVNALAKIQTKSTPLSQSWRYGPEVATVATHILNAAMIVKGSPHLDTVVGTVDTTKPYTQLFRTNVKLIQQGVKLIRQGVKVRMDVDVKGFVKMLTSMMALKWGETKNVKHEDVVIHATWDDLLEEAEVVKGELKLLSGLIERGNAQEVLDILGDYTKANNPHVILSTAHKSKGMEYNQVILADDFMDVHDDEGNFIEPNDMERNLLYVAATRAQGVLQLNKTVIDIIEQREKKSQPNSPCIEGEERSNEELYQRSA